MAFTLFLLFSFLFAFSRSDDPFEMSSFQMNRVEQKDDWYDNVATRSPLDYEKVVQLSQRPRVYLYKGFLTDEECDHLIKLAKGNLTRSTVGGPGLIVEGRTSTSMGIQKGYDKIVRAIEGKVETWTLLPSENAEGIHVIRYEKGQHYGAHQDYMHGMPNPIPGGDRVATVLMYLFDATKGGETYFPVAERFDHYKKYDPLSNCSTSGIAVKPRKGDAVLLFNLNLDESLDELSIHGSCAVIEGEKWTATSWIHVRAYTPLTSLFKKGACFDLNSHCEEWALSGQCERDRRLEKTCRKSCGICSDLNLDY